MGLLQTCSQVTLGQDSQELRTPFSGRIFRIIGVAVCDIIEVAGVNGITAKKS